MEPQNQIIASPDQAQLGFVRSIDNMAAAIEEKARANVMAELGPEFAQYGELEISAMVAVEQLRLTGAFDLASILVRYSILRKIREQNLLSIHPGRYTGLVQMAQEQGMSISELHDILMLGDIIFPFLEREYGPNGVADMWDRLGKARLRELVPSLNAVITDTRSQSARVREAIENATQQAALNTNAETERSDNAARWSEMESGEQRRRIARELIEIGVNATTIREMRANLTGVRTNDILFLSYETGEGSLIVARVSDDQKRMMNQLMHNHVDFQALENGNVGLTSIGDTFLSVQALLERSEVQLGEETLPAGS